MSYEKGHGQYIVECVGNAADAICESGVPHVGQSRYGNIVTEITVEMLTRNLWLVSLKVDPVK